MGSTKSGCAPCVVARNCTRTTLGTGTRPICAAIMGVCARREKMRAIAGLWRAAPSTSKRSIRPLRAIQMRTWGSGRRRRCSGFFGFGGGAGLGLLRGSGFGFGDRLRAGGLWRLCLGGSGARWGGSRLRRAQLHAPHRCQRRRGAGAHVCIATAQRLPCQHVQRSGCQHCCQQCARRRRTGSSAKAAVGCGWRGKHSVGLCLSCRRRGRRG